MVLPSGKKGLSIYQWLLKIFLVEILIEVSYPRRPNRTCGENSIVPNHDCCTIFCTWKHCCARIFTVVRSYLAILGEETLLLPWWWTTIEQPSIWHVGVCTQIRYGKNQSEIIYLSRKPSWILGFQTWDISKNAPHRLCMNVYVYECMHMSICLCIYVHNIVLNGQWWQNGHHRTGGTIF